jgi:hypothetical protein
MRPVSAISVGLVQASLALASGATVGATVAQAQTSVTREITSEPVETVITQGPNGTAVTRRILTPEPGVSTYAPPPLEYPPVAAEALAPHYVEPAAPALSTRRVTTTTTRTVGQAPVRSRIAATRSVTRRAAPPPARTVGQAAPPAVSDQALVLSPAQRQVIYRSVVQRVDYPAPAVPAAPADVYAPPVTGYPLRTVYPADNGYRDNGNRDYAYDPYHDRDYRDSYHSVYRWNGVPLVVGARMPASVPLVAVPVPVAVGVPAAQPYSYAVLDGRVYLVDPATSVIVAEITP